MGALEHAQGRIREDRDGIGPKSSKPDRTDGDRVIEASVEMARDWLRQAGAAENRAERTMARRMAALIDKKSDVEFTMAYVDQVARHRSHRLAAAQLHELVATLPTPRFLGPVDRLMLGIGARIAPLVPWPTMPIARRRMRRLVGPMVINAEPSRLLSHLAEQRAARFGLNVNLLGEALLGERESSRRLVSTAALIDRSDIDYVSVKVSGITSQIDLWSFDDSLRHVKDRLRVLYSHSVTSDPATFVNLDMEEYHDLEITLRAFTELLDEPELRGLDAGIALQAYVPESFDAMVRLVRWADTRYQPGVGEIKVRLVKGANLACERVDAVMQGWTPATYSTKAEVDANYKRCLDWLLTPEHLVAVRVGVASHNLFDIAWAKLLADRRAVANRVGFEMLQGMAPAQSRTVRDATGNLLLYTPIVEQENFDVAISYLIRRLDENTAPDNFLHHLFGLAPESREFEDQARRFRTAVRDRYTVTSAPRRTQVRPDFAVGFSNHPATDVSQPSVQRWLAETRRTRPGPCVARVTTEPALIDAAVTTARDAQPGWWALGAPRRREILWQAADEIDQRRGELLVTMASEAEKIFAESDSEITEAIDFARWYGERGLEVDRIDGACFAPLGVMAVVPPWNFPVAIPAGGTFAALAAGNSVILKPAPRTPRCAEIVAEAGWKAGVPRDVLQLVRIPDDDTGRRLITTVDGVILTGSWDTARLFRSWKPDMRLLAETSGKNALVITPQADFDLAVADLVRSAFGHVGQKCSAASLAILVGPTYHSGRFRRQLVDAVSSLRIGAAGDPASRISPTIGPVTGRLRRALTSLDRGETWLLEPRCLDESGALWSPGIRLGVKPGSWFQQTECFGPVLGLVRADTLDAAIKIQNSSPYGLTGGIHTLDRREIDEWVRRVEVGNAYVNRAITGAIVNRQPFGGWKRSSTGPGAQAGGPDYLLQLGNWQCRETDPDPSADAVDNSNEGWWTNWYSTEHDPSGLFCESNIHRYRPVPRMVLRVASDADPVDTARALAAAIIANPVIELSVDPSIDVPSGLGPNTKLVVETPGRFAARLTELRWGRVRLIGTAGVGFLRAADEAEVTVITETVTTSGRLELRHYLREQSVSRTLHRFGNVPGIGVMPGSRMGEIQESVHGRRSPADYGRRP